MTSTDVSFVRTIRGMRDVSDCAVSDLLHLAEMLKRGDLVHVDETPPTAPVEVHVSEGSGPWAA